MYYLAPFIDHVVCPGTDFFSVSFPLFSFSLHSYRSRQITDSNFERVSSKVTQLLNYDVNPFFYRVIITKSTGCITRCTFFTWFSRCSLSWDYRMFQKCFPSLRTRYFTAMEFSFGIIYIRSKKIKFELYYYYYYY